MMREQSNTMNTSANRLIRIFTVPVLLCLTTLRLPAQQTTTQTTTTQTPNNSQSQDQVVTMSPFDVTEDQNQVGYDSTLVSGANRIVTSIDDMAGSAFVINQELLEDVVPRYLADVTKYVAGVSRAYYYTPWDLITIRGNQSGTNLIDGFPLQSFTAFLPVALIQQVEVIKGSDGVLYGSVSGGGLINRVTKQPEDKPAGDVWGEIGSYGFWQAGVDLTGPIPELSSSNEHISYRFIYEYQEGGGGPQHDLVTNWPQTTLEGSIKADIPGGGLVTASISYVDRIWNPANQVTSGNPVTGLLNVSDFEQNSVYPSLVEKQTDTRAVVTAEKPIGPVQNRVSLQYSDNPWTDDALFPCCSDNGYGVNPLWARYRLQDGKTYNFYYDGVTKFNVGDLISNVINFGYEYQYYTNTGIQIVNYGPNYGYGNFNYPGNVPTSDDVFNLLDPNNQIQTDELETEHTWGAYANWKIAVLKDRFSIIGGMRYESYWENLSNRLAASLPPAEGSEHLYRAGAVLKIIDGINAFVSYDQTYTVNTSIGFIPPSSQVSTGDYLPNPAATSKEGGLHMEFLKHRLTIETSYYSLAQTGLTEGGQSSFQPIIFLPNETDTGFELQVTATPVPGWDFVGSYTNASILNADGTRAPNYSEILGNFYTKYTFQDGAFKGLGASIGMNYYGDQAPGALPTNAAGVVTNPNYLVPAETTFDAGLSYGWHNWRFQLNCENLTNNVYVTQFGGSLLAIWVSMGRQVTFSTHYKW
jgi:iron complex outermembrane recepter protein